MKISQIKKDLAGQYVDVLVYVASQEDIKIHSDYIFDVEEMQISAEDIDNADTDYIGSHEQCVCELMDEDAINDSVLANTEISFNDWYESGDKVLVIVLTNDYAHWLAMPFNERIGEFKEKTNSTNAEISKLIGVPLRTLENWKAGIRRPDNFKERIISEKLWLEM